MGFTSCVDYNEFRIIMIAEEKKKNKDKKRRPSMDKIDEGDELEI